MFLLLRFLFLQYLVELVVTGVILLEINLSCDLWLATHLDENLFEAVFSHSVLRFASVQLAWVMLFANRHSNGSYIKAEIYPC